MVDKIFWWNELGNYTTSGVAMTVAIASSSSSIVGSNTVFSGTITVRSVNRVFNYVPVIKGSFTLMVSGTNNTTKQQTVRYTKNDFVVSSGRLVGTINFEIDVPTGAFTNPTLSCSSTSNAIQYVFPSPSGNAEVQMGKNGFNMSFVIDGTKDSAKTVVVSYEVEDVIKPQTIVWHKNTNTWWVVGNDKVDKYINENGQFVYYHNLQLEGAIELLNARDLTDCGFNQKTYTIKQFAQRLFSLSNFEFSDDSISYTFGNNLDETKVVDYIKTFENYTLLSAMREFFDGYNCAVKLNFVLDGGNGIYGCTLVVCPKTGDIDRTPKQIDEVFNDIKEIKTLNKNSYGTTVVSNTENVVSTKSKMFPNIGFVRASGENFYITPADAVLRLPSKVNSVEFVDMLKGTMRITIGRNEHNFYDSYMNGWTTTHDFDTSDVDSYNEAIDWIRNTLTQSTQPSKSYVEENLDDEFWNAAKGQSALDTFNNYCSCRLYDINEYDPVNNRLISSHTIPQFYRSPAGNKPFVLGNKSLREGVQEPNCVMYWERGSNVIKGFDFFNWHGVSNIITSSTQTGVQFIYFSVQRGSSTYYYRIIFGACETDSDVAGYIKTAKTTYSLLDTYFRVKYVPMTDLKIKYDNSGYGKNIQLYNQNGRLTDGVALSKLLLSYKDNIESDNITRYASGYSYSDMPKVGDIILKNSVKYVINNVSLDFFQNEESDNGAYFIIGEYTLSKKVATKSLLTNPNTNIRDYGIPQNYNVQRKQLYRDFYELAFTTDSRADNDRYLRLDKVLNTRLYPREYSGHTALMKLTYATSWGGGGGTVDGGTAPASDTWYYQLDSTTYFLKKAMYEVFDFQDNNIIGYDSQNVSCGFDIRRLFNVIQVGSGNIDTVNTPISYVDPNGKFETIDMAVCSSEQLKEVWNTYRDVQASQLGVNYNGVLYNRCVFIPYSVYNSGTTLCDYRIRDDNYKKDALEVPVFEYSCQLDDSDDVIIGENILESTENDLRYLYELKPVNHGKVDDNNWRLYFESKDITYSSHVIGLDDTSSLLRKCGLFTISTNQLSIAAFQSVGVKDNEENITSGDMLDIHEWLTHFTGDIDLMVVRYTIPKDKVVSNGIITNVSTELMMVIKNAKQCPYDEYSLFLKINHYKLK